jgi:hypothetical protein
VGKEYIGAGGEHVDDVKECEGGSGQGRDVDDDEVGIDKDKAEGGRNGRRVGEGGSG